MAKDFRMIFKLNGQNTIAIVEKTEHEILEDPITVYNFGGGFLTYFVGDSIVLVHNDCSNSNSSSYINSTKKGSIFNRNANFVRI